MQPHALEWEEIEEHLHPLSPQPSESSLVRLSFTFDRKSQSISELEAELIFGSGSLVRLLFKEVWSNSNPGQLTVPDPLGSGILVVDVKHRGWMHHILVVADDEEQDTLFGAGSVQQL